jgi:hypothetical protein
MKNENHDLNEDIFSLMINHEFKHLSQEEKEIVQKTMKEEEYEHMRNIYFALEKSSKAGSRKDAIKSNLLQHFQKNNQPNASVFQRTFSFWQMAAVFVFTSLLSFIFLFTKTPHPSISVNTIIHDTLIQWRDNPTKTLVVYDTLYLPQKKNRPKPFNRNEAQIINKESIQIPQTDLAIQSFSEVNQPSNQMRHNSIKYDTLIRDIGFVRL